MYLLCLLFKGLTSLKYVRCAFVHLNKQVFTHAIALRSMLIIGDLLHYLLSPVTSTSSDFTQGYDVDTVSSYINMTAISFEVFVFDVS